MKIRIIGLSLVLAALTSETVAQPVQHYYDKRETDKTRVTPSARKQT